MAEGDRVHLGVSALGGSHGHVCVSRDFLGRWPSPGLPSKGARTSSSGSTLVRKTLEAATALRSAHPKQEWRGGGLAGVGGHQGARWPRRMSYWQPPCTLHLAESPGQHLRPDSTLAMGGNSKSTEVPSLSCSCPPRASRDLGTQWASSEPWSSNPRKAAEDGS